MVQKFFSCGLLLVAFGLTATSTATAADDTVTAAETFPAPTAWSKPVPNFTPVAPGEHPRLLFRKADLPALKARANTPEGKAIIARLKATLGGGEAMPTILNPAKSAYSSDSNSSPLLKKEGAYTISHAAGFGLLYQLTGETKYADLSRKCVELALAGQRDRDDRYALVSSGADGQLRVGPAYGMYCLAYDLCYDAWPQDFRNIFIQKLMTLNTEGGLDLKSCVLKPKHGPTSNHYGAVLGGSTLAVLAIAGDPGVDSKFIDAALPALERGVQSLFTEGWGDAGWFAESTGPSHVSSNSGILPALQAFKNAQGKDFTDHPEVNWLALRWAYDIFLRDGRPVYPARMISENATYGTEDFLGVLNGGSFTHGGWFQQGFGVVPERYKPALLWMYQNAVAKAMGDDYGIRNYPHQAILSFLNWPFGMKPQSPEEVLSKIRVDSRHGYYSFRTDWTLTDDIILTSWTNTGPRGFIGKKGGGAPGANHGEVALWSFSGKRINLGKMIGTSSSLVWKDEKDGSGQVACGDQTFAVDFSKRSGVEAVIVGRKIGGGNGNDARVWMVSRALDLDGNILSVVTVSKTGMHPTPRVDAANHRLVVGGETITFQDGKFTFGTADEATVAANPKPFDGNAAMAKVHRLAAEADAKREVPESEASMPTDPPALSFSFDTVEKEGGKQIFRDSSPNGLKAWVKGAPVVLQDGVKGKAVLLNGLDNVIVVDPNKALDMTGKGVSIAMWFKNDGTDPGTEWVLLEKNTWQGSKAPDCYSLCVDAGGLVGFNTPNCTGFKRSPLPWSDGKWHFIASVYDVESKSMALYLDGKLLVLKDKLDVKGPIGPGSSPLTIGARGAEMSANQFAGFIDEVDVYNRPLTRGEIRALYDKAKPEAPKQPPPVPR
jgi:hypothetical protein